MRGTVAAPGTGAPGETTVGEGVVSPGNESGASVPYVDVYSFYEEAMREAIDSGHIPLFLRPVIRDYFSSLEP